MFKSVYRRQCGLEPSQPTQEHDVVEIGIHEKSVVRDCDVIFFNARFVETSFEVLQGQVVVSLWIVGAKPNGLLAEFQPLVCLSQIVIKRAQNIERLHVIRVNRQGPLCISNAFGSQLFSITLRRVEALVVKICNVRQDIGVLGVFLQGPFELVFRLCEVAWLAKVGKSDQAVASPHIGSVGSAVLRRGPGQQLLLLR